MSIDHLQLSASGLALSIVGGEMLHDLFLSFFKRFNAFLLLLIFLI